MGVRQAILGCSMTNETRIEETLRADGQLEPGPVVITPLTGGVSCEIYRIEQGQRQFVFKRAHERLRVAEEWLVDTSRNETEFAFYDTLANILPGAIPRVIFHNPERGYFLMEYFDEGWRNWKALLLEADFERTHGALAGTLLAKLHGGTWKDETFHAQFDATANFRQLRTDPYFRAAAVRRPALRELLLDVAAHLDQLRICLIHGDFSPKNILIHDKQMVLLDAEVACFGDPAFDVAFLQTHLFLKGLYFSPQCSDWGGVAAAAWDSYRNAMTGFLEDGFERRCVRMLAALLIARVDGKSPVEYLAEEKRAMIRHMATDLLENPPSDFHRARAAWCSMIQCTQNENLLD